MMETSPQDVLKICHFLGVLKHLKRTGWVNESINEPESVASHMYRMAMLALLFVDENDAKLDKNKCIRMALVHDLAESIVGDISPYCGVDYEEKIRREKEAMLKIATFLPQSSGDQLLALWSEYEERQSCEAKFVKQLDWFDMIVQADEYEQMELKPGRLQSFFDSVRKSAALLEKPFKNWTEYLYSARNQRIDDEKSKFQ